MKSPFLLKKRGKYWHTRLANEKTFHTTGKTTKPRAIDFVQERIGKAPISTLTLMQYIDPYFVLDQCPHVRRLLNEGKSVTRQNETSLFVLGKPVLPELEIAPDFSPSSSLIYQSVSLPAPGGFVCTRGVPFAPKELYYSPGMLGVVVGRCVCHRIGSVRPTTDEITASIVSEPPILRARLPP